MKRGMVPEIKCRRMVNSHGNDGEDFKPATIENVPVF